MTTITSLFYNWNLSNHLPKVHRLRLVLNTPLHTAGRVQVANTMFSSLHFVVVDSFSLSSVLTLEMGYKATVFDAFMSAVYANLCLFIRDIAIF